MAAIFPIPTGRSSDLLIQTRLLTQLQTDQLDLLKLQDQLSTGRRISAPSEDAPAAIRGMGLQQLLEQKGQAVVNLETSKSYLTATEGAISSVTDILANIRATALSVADSTTGETGRQAAIQEIRSALNQLTDIGNQKFRGRFLFSGSKTTVRPFELDGEFITYQGNESDLRSFADIDVLFETTVPGNDVFGAISPEVKGTADLNPILTAQTRLSDLRGGQGVSDGSFTLSDGVNSSTIDISTAETVGDVLRMIETNPPAGRTIIARLTATGLTIDIDDAGGGNFSIREVGGGTTAAELGILEDDGIGVGTVIGEDLDPVLRLTTPLANILGTRATAIVESAGDNNDIYLEARLRGAEYNDFTVQFVDDELLQAAPGLTAGNETANYSSTATAARASLALSGADNDLILTADTPGVDFNNVTIVIDSTANLGNAATTSYNAVTKTFTIGIDDTDETTLGTLVTQINASGIFTATADPSAGEGYNAAGFVLSADGGAVTGNTGNSGGEANTIFVNIDPGNTTANDVLAALQADATIDSLFETRLDGKDTTLPVDQGKGIIDLNSTVATAGGSGVEFDKNSGIQVINGKETFAITFEKAQTVEDMLNILNKSDAQLLAEINADGTGINIRSRLSGSDFHIGENGGTTASELGIRTFTTDTRLSDLNHGIGVHTTDGADFIIRRNDGVELEIDVSGALTIEDVLDRINNHVDNLDPTTAIVARLKATGNGIELVDDNPVGTGTLTIIQDVLSEAAWDLGLLPRGVQEGTSGDGPPPTAATATVAFSPPNDQNNRFIITANNAGDLMNGVQVNFVNVAAAGDTATVAYDPLAKTLTIDVDPAATTANTVIAAIAAEGTFTAALDPSIDPTNDGTGLITETGLLAVTSGGTPNTAAVAASAAIAFPAPNDVNTALQVIANYPGTGLNGVTIEFQDTLAGDVATATYDPGLNRLLIDIDMAATTANTVANAIQTEGTFRAMLDTTNDPTNDGTGIVGTVGVLATTAGGEPEVLVGTDVNPLETKGVFNSLIRLDNALDNFDLVQIERAIKMLDDDFDRITFTRAELGAREQGLDTLQVRLENEEIDLKSLLSLEIDTDLVQAISELTARQASFDASLRMIGRAFQLSLLNFL